MVRLQIQSKIWAALLTLAISSSSFAATMPLSQKDVAELLLRQGLRTQETNLSYELQRLPLAQALLPYDWRVNLEAGYELDRTASFLMGFNSAAIRYNRYRTTASVGRTFFTGTIFSLGVSRISQKIDLTTVTQSTLPPPQQTLDTALLTLEQPLWGNAFGISDRAVAETADLTFKSQQILRVNDLEQNVLDGIRQFWNTYVASENLKQSIVVRDRYKKLVDTVRRKTGYGYSNPGELSQAQAEAEIREQNMKLASIDYIRSQRALNTGLHLAEDTVVEFNIPTAVPPAPTLPEIGIEELRAVQSQKIKLDAAEANLRAAESRRHPSINLVGQAGTSGVDVTPEGSSDQLLAGTRPRYYLGLRFTYNFGADFQAEDVSNKFANRELEKTRLERIRMENKDLLDVATRNVQVTYTILQSATKQKEYRDKAVVELTKAYSQSRTDINTLIIAMNNQVAADLQMVQSIGNYNISLNELAAARDELIPSEKAK